MGEDMVERSGEAWRGWVHSFLRCRMVSRMKKLLLAELTASLVLLTTIATKAFEGMDAEAIIKSTRSIDREIFESVKWSNDA
jgi:hypothetical protein